MSELLAAEGVAARRRVLVGLAPDARCRGVLRSALQLCRPGADSELHVANAVAIEPRLHDLRHAAELAALLRASVAELRAFVEARTRSRRGPERVFHVRVGGAADVLLQLAAEVDAGVIVVGGRTPYPRSSLAGALIQHSRTPVLIAHVASNRR